VRSYRAQKSEQWEIAIREKCPIDGGSPREAPD